MQNIKRKPMQNIKRKSQKFEPSLNQFKHQSCTHKHVYAHKHVRTQNMYTHKHVHTKTRTHTHKNMKCVLHTHILKITVEIGYRPTVDTDLAHRFVHRTVKVNICPKKYPPFASLPGFAPLEPSTRHSPILTSTTRSIRSDWERDTAFATTASLPPPRPRKAPSIRSVPCQSTKY